MKILNVLTVNMILKTVIFSLICTKFTENYADRNTTNTILAILPVVSVQINIFTFGR